MKFFKELASLTNTKAFKIGGTAALVLLIPLTLVVSQQQQDIRQRAQQAPATAPVTQASISFSPQNTTVFPNQPFPVSIMLSPYTYTISGVDMTITFNKDVLTAIEFYPGAALESVVTTIDNTAGTIRFAAVDRVNKPIKSQDIQLGQIIFEAKTTGSSVVNTQNVQIVAANMDTPVPSQTYLTKYFVVLPTPTPTITPIPTNTPTPLPTNVPTIPPTATPIPTNTPVPPTPTKAILVGDLNNDTYINVRDYNDWRDEFIKVFTTKKTDTNKDGNIDLLDFNIWRTAFIAPYQLAPTPTFPPVKTVILNNVAGSVNLHAGGTVTVEVASIQDLLYSFKLSGSLSGLQPNRVYKVYVCLQTGTACSTSSTPVVKTNATGSTTFSNLLVSSYNRPTNVITTIKVVEELPEGPVPDKTCSTTLQPCLMGNYNP